MTQKALIIAYIREYGDITPAKMGGRPYKDGFFGSETSKRCRELRVDGILWSEPNGKFERFKLFDSIKFDKPIYKPVKREAPRLL